MQIDANESEHQINYSKMDLYCRNLREILKEKYSISRPISYEISSLIIELIIISYNRNFSQ